MTPTTISSRSDVRTMSDLNGGSSACPACGATAERSLLTVEAIAVNCSALHCSAGEARSARTGRLELTVCETCSYVRNRAFDPAVMTYTEEYENALDFSPRFREYRDALADELVERHRLLGGDVVEIGCGQGAFLASLCRDGRAHGVGFDPTHRPGDEALPATVRVEPEYFHPATDTVTVADLFCARHVLEHVPDPLSFLRDLHTAVTMRDAAVYLEVPSGNAIFGGDGCWDLIYQHVSYFSPGALVGVAERAGYAVTDVRERFGDQYLSIEAKSVGASTVVRPDVHTFVERAVSGSAALLGRLERARARIADEHAAGRAVAVWGAGAKAVTFLSLLADVGVDAAVDLNPRKLGTFLPGSAVEVTAPASLADVQPSTVFIFNPVYRDEISSSLADMGLIAEVLIP